MSNLRRQYYQELGVPKAVLNQLDFSDKARKCKVPLYGKIQLTNRCNLRCCHCYINDSESIKKPSRRIPSKRLVSIIDEIAAAGCLYLTLTGGEPLSVPDFSTFYIRAKKKGMLVSVFTNGTLLNDQHITLFKTYRPHYIDITLYGASREVYESITGIPGSYDLCIHAVRLLLKNNINVRLKTTLMTLNVHELDAMETIANNFGVPFRSSSDMIPAFNGDTTPLTYRLPPEQTIDLELASPKARLFWQSTTKAGIRSPQNKLFQCHVGQASFVVNADGDIQPCEQLRDPHLMRSILDRSFAEIWQEIITLIPAIPMPPNHPCTNCAYRSYCQYCPAASYLEHGHYDLPSSTSCQLAKLRYSHLHGVATNRVILNG